MLNMKKDKVKVENFIKCVGHDNNCKVAVRYSFEYNVNVTGFKGLNKWETRCSLRAISGFFNVI